MHGRQKQLFAIFEILSGSARRMDFWKKMDFERNIKGEEEGVVRLDQGIIFYFFKKVWIYYFS